jgi:hypothetical protein
MFSFFFFSLNSGADNVEVRENACTLLELLCEQCVAYQTEENLSTLSLWFARTADNVEVDDINTVQPPQQDSKSAVVISLRRRALNVHTLLVVLKYNLTLFLPNKRRCLQLGCSSTSRNCNV